MLTLKKYEASDDKARAAMEAMTREASKVFGCDGRELTRLCICATKAIYTAVGLGTMPKKEAVDLLRTMQNARAFQGLPALDLKKHGDAALQAFNKAFAAHMDTTFYGAYWWAKLYAPALFKKVFSGMDPDILRSAEA